jgi:hypothetical protein
MWDSAESVSAFPWDQVSLFAGEIDVRAQINTFLDNRGHSVFVRKRSNRRCSCWSARQFDESDPYCPRCDGYGWIYYDYLYKARRRPAFGTYGFAPKVRSPLGDLTASDSIWYFKHDETIAEAYCIIEVSIDADGDPTKPYHFERVHDVKLAHAYRDQKGRIEYWAALARERVVGK